VTDPVWLQRLSVLDPGIYPNSLLTGSVSCKMLLTASISEGFEGFHYKLIAGVITLLDSPRSRGAIAPAASTR
jgi:hypothetical protein